jgi:hypothetical protein
VFPDPFKSSRSEYKNNHPNPEPVLYMVLMSPKKRVDINPPFLSSNAVYKLDIRGQYKVKLGCKNM